MTWAEFEEKTYEVAAAIELSTGSSAFGPVFAPGQVLEDLLGFDAAASPGEDHVIWRILKVPRPTGIRLLPPLWAGGSRPPATQLPQRPISLILQYKRPEYLRGARAAQWSIWRRPYFRITRTRDQQTVLLRLERNLNSAAVVSYAAPAFWRSEALEAAQLARQVLSQSGFVTPANLGSHSVWTYRLPGTSGVANPRFEHRPFQTIEQLLQNRRVDPDQLLQNRQLVVVGSVLRVHLSELAQAARRREPQVRAGVATWMAQLRDSNVDAESAAIAGDFATVATVLSRIGADWAIIGG